MQRIVIEIANPASNEVKMSVDKTVVGTTNDYESLITKIFYDNCNRIIEDLNQMAKEVGANVTTTHKIEPDLSDIPNLPVDKPTK